MRDALTVLLVTEDKDLERELLPRLRGEKRSILVSDGLRKGIRMIEQGEVDLLLIDGAFPEEVRVRLVRAAKASDQDTHVFVLTDVPDLSDKTDVDGVLGRPPDPLRLRDTLERAERRWSFLRECRLLGRSPQMREVREKIAQIAAMDVIVLITGESGTGKSEVAEALHRFSRRAERPFQVVNCGAIPETLLESELFGHERGAFTDARTQRKGIFEAADGGSVFLDEIGEMSLSAQVRLLHVIEEKEVTRLGSAQPIPVDVRIVAATNRDLGLAVQQGHFRQDLYYRLNVIEIRMSALRERPEDIPELVNVFVADYARTHGIPAPEFAGDAIAALGDYAWPGNVRELKNLVERLMVLSRGMRLTRVDILRHLNIAPETITDGRSLPIPLNKTPDEAQRDLIYWALLDLKKDVAELKALLRGNVRTPSLPVGFPLSPMPLAPGEVPVEEAAVSEPEEDSEGLRALAEVEREYIRNVLHAVGGNRRKAARILGIGERTLYRKINESEEIDEAGEAGSHPPDEDGK